MKQTTCSIIGYPINKFTFRYDETQENCIKLKMKLAVHIEEMRNKDVTTHFLQAWRRLRASGERRSSLT